MHFATGMACGAALGGFGCLVVRRGWRFIPAFMTVCGIWANVPDMPRLWREDSPWMPFASTLGSMKLEHWLHYYGDIFFFHKQFDSQPNEYALHGLILMILQYNLAIVGLMWLERRQRNSLGNRMHRAHGSRLHRRGAGERHAEKPAPSIRLAGTEAEPLPPEDSHEGVIARLHAERMKKPG